MESGGRRRVEIVSIDRATMHRRVVGAEHGRKWIVADHRRRGRREGEILLEGTSRGNEGIGIEVGGIESVRNRRMGVLLLHAAKARMIKRVIMEISIGIKAVSGVVGSHGGDVRREIGRALAVQVLDKG